MRTFESFCVGDSFTLGPLTVTEHDALAFARQFDPQPFHLDHAAAAHSLLGGLALSGWHSGALFMKMFHAAVLVGSTSQGGPGIDEIRWLKPVYAGDTLSGTALVMNARASRSLPGIGLVGFRHVLSTPRSGCVMRLSHTVMFRRAGH